MNILGIDLGGSRVKLAIVDAGRVKELKVFPISRGLPMGAVLDAIEAQAKGMAGIAECQGVGFAYPGLVDMENQRVLCINDKYADAAETDFSRWARERFGLKLLLINDAAAALCGEMTYGAGRGADSGALLMVGTGIGTAAWAQAGCLQASTGPSAFWAGTSPLLTNSRANAPAAMWGAWKRMRAPGRCPAFPGSIRALRKAFCAEPNPSITAPWRRALKRATRYAGTFLTASAGRCAPERPIWCTPMIPKCWF